MQEISMFGNSKSNELKREDIHNLIWGLDGVQIKKLLPEVRKIIKKITSTPVWYGYSEDLMEEYGLKSKDEYAVIKGKYREFDVWDDGTQSFVKKKCNFRACPQARSYVIEVYMDIEVIDGTVKINNVFG